MNSETIRKTVTDPARCLREIALAEKMGATLVTTNDLSTDRVVVNGVAHERQQITIEATFEGADLVKARNKAHEWHGSKA